MPVYPLGQANDDQVKFNSTTSIWERAVGTGESLPVGTVDDSTLRWDAALADWVENVDVLASVVGRLTLSENIIAVDGAFSGDVSAVNAAFTGTLGVTLDATFSADAYAGGQLTAGATVEAFSGNTVNVAGTGRILGYSSAVTGVDKTVELLGMARVITEGPFTIIFALGRVAANNVSIGGGGADDAATLVEIRTAAAVDTPTGTVRATWDSAGVFNQVGDATIGGTLGVTGNITGSADLTLNGAQPVVLIGDGVTVGGTSVIRLRKEATGTSDLFFQVGTGASADDKRFRHSAGEELQLQNHNGASWDNLMTLTTTVAMNAAVTCDATLGVTGLITATAGVDSVLDIRCRTLFADGDEGTGIAGTVGLTNVVDAAGDTAAVLGNWRVNASAGVFHGWVKMWDGTTYVSVPAWVAA